MFVHSNYNKDLIVLPAALIGVRRKGIYKSLFVVVYFYMIDFSVILAEFGHCSVIARAWLCFPFPDGIIEFGHSFLVRELNVGASTL